MIVANTSRRNWEVRHYIRETGKNILMVIPMGHQEEIKHLTPKEQEAFIAHLRRFGALERTEVHQKHQGFEGLVYSMDRPLREEEFRAGNEEVLDEAQSRAVVEATRSAVAGDVAVAKQTRGKRMVGDTEVAMEQEERGKNGRREQMRVTVTPTVAQSDRIPLQ